MHKSSLISFTFLYVCATFLMLGQYIPLGNTAFLFVGLSGYAFAGIDFLCKRNKHAPSFVLRAARFPVVLRWLLLCAAIVFVLLECAFLVFGSAYITHIYVFSYTPLLLVVVALLGVVWYMAQLDENQLMAMTKLAGLIFLCFFGLFMLLVFQAPRHALLPLHIPTKDAMLRSAGYFFFAHYIHTAVLGALIPREERNYFRIGIVLGATLLLITYACNVVIMQSDVMAQFAFPTVLQTSILSFRQFLQRWEIFTIFGALLVDMLKMTVLLRFLFRICNVTIQKHHQKTAQILTVLAVCALGYFLFPTFIAWQTLMASILILFGCGCFVLWVIQ